MNQAIDASKIDAWMFFSLSNFVILTSTISLMCVKHQETLHMNKFLSLVRFGLRLEKTNPSHINNDS